MSNVPNADSGRWNMERTMYKVNKVSNANYFAIMYYIDDNGKYSLYTVQMKNSFNIAPEILIVRESKSSFGGLFGSKSDKIITFPRSMTPVDLQQLMDYFDMVAFERFMKLFNQNIAIDVFEDLAEYKVESPAQVGQSIDGFKNLLGVVDSTWSTVKNIFSSSSKTAIVEKITNLGFSKLQSTCFIQMYKGVPQDKFEAVKRTIISSTEVPADKLGVFNDWWDLAQYTSG